MIKNEVIYNIKFERPKIYNILIFIILSIFIKKL